MGLLKLLSSRSCFFYKSKFCLRVIATKSCWNVRHKVIFSKKLVTIQRIYSFNISNLFQKTP